MKFKNIRRNKIIILNLLFSLIFLSIMNGPIMKVKGPGVRNHSSDTYDFYKFTQSNSTCVEAEIVWTSVENYLNLLLFDCNGVLIDSDVSSKPPNTVATNNVSGDYYPLVIFDGVISNSSFDSYRIYSPYKIEISSTGPFNYSEYDHSVSSGSFSYINFTTSSSGCQRFLVLWDDTDIDLNAYLFDSNNSLKVYDTDSKPYCFLEIECQANTSYYLKILNNGSSSTLFDVFGTCELTSSKFLTGALPEINFLVIFWIFVGSIELVVITLSISIDFSQKRKEKEIIEPVEAPEPMILPELVRAVEPVKPSELIIEPELVRAPESPISPIESFAEPPIVQFDETLRKVFSERKLYVEDSYVTHTLDKILSQTIEEDKKPKLLRVPKLTFPVITDYEKLSFLLSKSFKEFPYKPIKSSIEPSIVQFDETLREAISERKLHLEDYFIARTLDKILSQAAEEEKTQETTIEPELVGASEPVKVPPPTEISELMRVKKLARTQKPAITSKPVETPKPIRALKPVKAPPPMTISELVRARKLARTQKPAITSKPVEAPKPEIIPKPMRPSELVKAPEPTIPSVKIPGHVPVDEFKETIPTTTDMGILQTEKDIYKGISEIKVPVGVDLTARLNQFKKRTSEIVKNIQIIKRKLGRSNISLMDFKSKKNSLEHELRDILKQITKIKEQIEYQELIRKKKAERAYIPSAGIKVLTIIKPTGRRRCPKCGNSDNFMIREMSDRESILLVYPRIYGKKFRCGLCGVEWREK